MLKKLTKKAIGKLLWLRYNSCMKYDNILTGKYGSFRFLADYSIDCFKICKQYNDAVNLQSIQKKTKIRFGFVVYTSSMWNVDELYHSLKQNECFETHIIVAHLEMSDDESSKREYQKTLAYFTELQYDILEAQNLTKNDRFDILFYMTPFSLLDKNIDLFEISLNTIILHTSYSYMLAGNEEKLNIWMYHWALKYYTDSEYYKKLIEKTKYYTGNAEYLGFPKMDKYYTAETFRPSTKKVIIYAPHHSVHYEKFKSATFEDNYLAILELAKKYTDTTYWVYKPHPLLRANSVLGGVFNSVEEYDEYEKAWSDLENAEVMTSGEYYSIFKGSDAMITDSVSFLAEYQFTGKPLLLLESGKETYNEFGENIISILYKCDGKSIAEIESFVTDVIDDNDQMKGIRETFFKENLSYIQQGTTANSRIYEDIVKMTHGECEEKMVSK